MTENDLKAIKLRAFRYGYIMGLVSCAGVLAITLLITLVIAWPNAGRP